MLVEAIAAFAIGGCFPLYGQIATVSIQFEEGSVEISDSARREIAEAVEPIIGNPLAEVELQASYPYGTRESDPAFMLAHDRNDAVRQVALQLGLASDLIGRRQSAIGWDMDGSGQRVGVPYPREQLQIVEMNVRVKEDCHPLADLARRLNPYR
jgi:hypothetical protein